MASNALIQTQIAVSTPVGYAIYTQAGPIAAEIMTNAPGPLTTGPMGPMAAEGVEFTAKASKTSIGYSLGDDEERGKLRSNG